MRVNKLAVYRIIVKMQHHNVLDLNRSGDIYTISISGAVFTKILILRISLIL